MTPRPSLHPLLSKLTPIAVIALVVCPSCSMMAMPPGDSRAPFANVRGRQPAATTRAQTTPFRQPQGRYPDPRYRPPGDISELRAVADKVAKSTGRDIRWRLTLGSNPGPLALIRGGIDDCTIFIHPVGARTVPPNTWAFIIGHEFAHRVENLGNHSQSNPANELKADIAGARYAMSAGYRLEAFLGWVLTEPNSNSASHGSLHQRVHAIAAHFGVPQKVIQAEAQRYSKYRTSR